jgi:hypothetical protein
MKKLMTISKSKYYMLKVNYAKIFNEIESEDTDIFEAAKKQEESSREETINQDKAASERQKLISRLRAPYKNIEMGIENMQESIKEREAIFKRDQT